MRKRPVLVIGIAAVLLAVACDPTAPAASAPVASNGPTPSSGVSTTPSIAPPVATSFSTPLLGDKAGRLRLSTVLTADGTPVAGARVTVAITSIGETYQVLKLKGIVPKPAKSLIVQLGFNNQPDTGPAEYDVRIYRITYADGGKSKSRLPNGGFDSGLYRWAVYGEGKVTTPNSDLGDGRLLRLRASPHQEIVINSYGIPVTPESAYTMTVTARVRPSGSVSGYVAAIFLKEKEIWRETLKVVAAPIPSSDLETGADGGISVEAALPAGRYRVRLSYIGGPTHMPVTIDQEVTVT